MALFEPRDRLKPLMKRIAALARDAGVDLYAVGGTVRDTLLDRKLNDLDIAVNRDALGFGRTLADALGGHFVVLDDEHAVARVALDERAVRYVDVAQLQGSLEDDLRRRDFTIDALAAPIEGGEIIDVHRGLDDLAARRLRMTGVQALDDDPLRLLRGVRLSTELSLEIERATAAAIRARAMRVAEAARERIRDELVRIFATERAADGVRLLDALGLLDALLPEVCAGRGVEQPKEHRYDVFEHGVRAVEAMDIMLSQGAPAGDAGWKHADVWRIFAWRAEAMRAYLSAEMSDGRRRATLLKIAALLHDVAKPQTKSVDANGRVRFLGHADIGAEVATAIMRRLRFSSREVNFVATLVREHLRPVQLAQVGEVPTLRALYRLHRDTGEALEGVLLLSLADAAAARGEHMTRESWMRQAAYMNSLLVRLQGEDGIVRAPRLVTGHDIMDEFGVREGPRVGELLEAVREAQATAQVRDRDGALAFVRALLDEGERTVSGADVQNT